MTLRSLLLAAALLLAGCAHRAPQAITLPSTVPVRRALAVATSSNARAVQIVERAQKSGIAAGSADLHDLTAALQDTTMQLATTKAALDQLTAQLLAKQRTVDAQTQSLATLTAKYNAAVKTIWWYRLRFWGPLVFALLAVSVFVVARFTAWGARTLGPYLVDAEHVAVKAAVLA